MAVVSVNKLWEGREGSRNWQGQRKYSMIFEVLLDDVTSAGNLEDQVGNAVDPVTALKVPIQGDAHPNDAAAVCTDTNPYASDESPFIWYLKADYDTNPDTPAGTDPVEETESGGPGSGGGKGDVPGTQTDNPLTRKPVYKTGSIDKEEVVREWLKVKENGNIDPNIPGLWANDVDVNAGEYKCNGANIYRALTTGVTATLPATGPAGVGQAIVDGTVTWAWYTTVALANVDPAWAVPAPCLNSGKCPFDPPAMTPVSIPTIIITFNAAQLSFGFIARIKNAVNKYRWKGLGARWAKVISCECGAQTENNVQFFQYTMTIGIDDATWDSRILDAGLGTLSLEHKVANPTPPPKLIAKKVFTRFKDAAGDFVDQAVPMNGKGDMLEADASPVMLRGVPRQMKLLDFGAEIPI